MLTSRVNRYRARDFTRFNDSLHEAIRELDDFAWSPWLLRCVEFHFGQGRYAVNDHFGWHIHRELQLEIILEGALRFTAKGKKAVEVRRGEVFVVPPNRMHRWKCLEPALMVGVSLAPVPRADAGEQLLEDALRATLLKPTGLSTLADALIREFRSRSTNKETSFGQRLRAWVFLMVSQVLAEVRVVSVPRKDQSKEADSSSRGQRVVSKIIRFIDANIDGDLSMKRFEQAVGLSSRQIHRIFMEVTGSSCHAYVLNRRLEVALSMLQADSRISVKEVAYGTGFASPAHFSSSFRKTFGVSPSEYFPARYTANKDSGAQD